MAGESSNKRKEPMLDFDKEEEAVAKREKAAGSREMK